MKRNGKPFTVAHVLPRKKKNIFIILKNNCVISETPTEQSTKFSITLSLAYLFETETSNMKLGFNIREFIIISGFI